MRIVCGKRGLATVALMCHLLTTFGFPVPTSPKKKNGTAPFPCQDHPCGCQTPEEGWKGDCCCFTLEEKLRWAEERGIEPPAHVRPLVESRKSPATPSAIKKQKCAECDATTDTEPAPAPSGPPTQSASACCEEPPAAQQPSSDNSSVRWVAGVYAQKCKGQGPAGLFLAGPHQPLT